MKNHGSGVVVFVHGLWLTGIESMRLRQSVERESGFATRVFRYPSVRASLHESADRLRTYLSELEAPELHLVGHSLGGVVILDCLRRYALDKPGRVVLLASPVRGSVAARRLSQWRLMRAALGHGISDLLASEEYRYEGSREIGTLAGTAPLGLGRVFTHLDKPHDGTVRSEETRLDGAADRIELPVSHTGLLFSSAVGHQIAAFLAHGKFDHACT